MTVVGQTVNRSPGMRPRPSFVSPQLGLSGRSRIGVLRGIQIASVGSYVPDQIVRNEDLAALGCDSDWIMRRTGILERRRAAPEQATSDLALIAAQRCLERAGVSATEIDLLIVATMTPDNLSPSTACHLQRGLGCIAPAMDINAACSGFMYAMVTAGQFLRCGAASNALVVGAEIMSRIVNPADVKTYPLFGDGAGAVLMRSTDDMSKGLESFTLGAEGSGGQMLCVPAGGSRQALTAQLLAEGAHYLQMEGKAVFKWAVNVVAESARDCMNHAKVTVDDLDCVILHQANSRIIDSAVSDFSIDPARVFMNLDRYGNTSAASIPLALDEAISSGKLPPGGKSLLCGFGAGLTWGTAIIQF
jgi:3-oxoacyl-[acyl-carrier-protein] synthase III